MVRMSGRSRQKAVQKDVIRVKAKIYDSSTSTTQTKTFSVDPELTTFSILRELLIKAFNIKEDFVVSYLVSDHDRACNSQDDRYLPMLSDWDFNTAVYAASDPNLALKVDLKSTHVMAGLEEWDIIDDDDVARASNSTSIASCVPFVQEVSSHDHPVEKPARKRRSWFFDRTKCDHSPPTRDPKMVKKPPPPPKHPMTESEFKSYLDAEGRLLHSSSFREAVYKSGLEPRARRLVWPHLLNVYPEGLTGQERASCERRLCEKYECLKESWRRRLERGFVDEELRLVANSVRKDVVRTDRFHPFFSGDEDRNRNLMALFNVLTTYAMAHPEVSYCQGMSDLASPLLAVVKDEAAAYLCFCALMRRLRENFSCDGWTMTRKFHQLGELVQYYDPIFYEYLREMHSEDLLFAYRWLLLELKREFAFDDALVLMEVSWASMPRKSDDGAGCEPDLYDVDLTAFCDDVDAPIHERATSHWSPSLSVKERAETASASGEGNVKISNLGTRFGHRSSPPTIHSCPGIFACSGGVCPALVIRSLMLDQKENKRLHAIRHASYPPEFTYDDVTLGRSYSKSRRDQNQRFTIGCWTDDLKAEFTMDMGAQKFLEPIFDDTASESSSDSEESQEQISTGGGTRLELDGDYPKSEPVGDNRINPELAASQGAGVGYLTEPESVGGQSEPESASNGAGRVTTAGSRAMALSEVDTGEKAAPRTYSLRPSPELKVSDSKESSTERLLDRQAVPVAAEAFSDCQTNAKASQQQPELTLSRIHEICLANIPMDDSAMLSSKTSSACVSRRSREPSGNTMPRHENGVGGSAFTTTDMSHISTRASSIANTADSGIFDAGFVKPESVNAGVDVSEFVNVDRDPTVALPPPNDLGDGNPFMLFVCLTLILQHRDQIMKANLDFNEIAVYFDRLMRKHDVQKILKRARILYADYLKMNMLGREGCMGISKAVAMSGAKCVER